jgi:AcrR family transcriptional regulator
MASSNPYAESARSAGSGALQPLLTDAQRSLQSALIEFRDAYPGREPSVKALCSAAFVARSTFYAYYHNVDDVLADVENRLVVDLLRINDPLMSKVSDPAFFRSTMEYVRAHELTFHALLIAAPDRRFTEAWKSAIKYHLWERLFGEGRSGENAAGAGAGAGADTSAGVGVGEGALRRPVAARRPTANRELLLEMVAAMTVDAFAFYLEHPTQVDEREVSAIVASVLGSIDVVL